MVDRPKTPTKAICETTRERETFKYDGSLLTSARFNNDGQPIPSAQLVTCSDGTLTALAQLAACQTGTSRSLISLFDRTHQYIITEATPSLPLIPSLPQSGHDEELWLCGTAIPRAHGVCDYTLCAHEPNQFDQPSSTSEKLPMVIVDDLTADSRFMTKPYCKPGSPARFYAATPIRTHRGINIGVICVIHTEPVTDWSERQSDLMRNLSRIVMGHLEASRLKNVQARNERMTRGLGFFLEGAPTSSSFDASPGSEDPPEASQETVQENDNTATDQEHQFVFERHIEPESNPTAAFGSVLPDDVPNDTTRNVRHYEEPLPSVSFDETNHHPESMFSKAANIISESIEIEGCVFVDGSSETSTSATPSQNGSVSIQPLGSGTASHEHEQTGAPMTDWLWLPCRVLGSSRSATSGKPSSIPPPKPMQQRFLARLLHRYPNGHIFNFDAKNSLQRSDSSNENLPRLLRSNTNKKLECIGESNEYQDPSRTRKDEGRILLETFPEARSIAFVPIWNPKKEGWSIGAFAHTTTPTRIFTVEGDLNYLRAFGMLATTEKLRLETVMADKAKADALGSLSHELRSPLHGIILGVELLNDTTLNVVQENMAHMIETCCRTLVDTVDHLLDFSKINNFMDKERALRRGSTARGLRVGDDQSIEAGMQALAVDTRLDTLVEEVMESVYAGFNFQHLSITQLSRKKATRLPDTDNTAIRRLDSARAMEDLGPILTQKGEVQVKFGEVTIVLMVDPSLSWNFHTQPGAVRRIVMNLFGNALKYTHRGVIKVSLDYVPSESSFDGRLVNLTVADTGVGISDAFLRDDLFKAFSQENSLAPGTGLGLSLVKQIVDQLDGNISVKSQVGVGTTVSVSLRLTPVMASTEIPLELSAPEITIQAQMRELHGLRFKLVGFNKKLASGETLSTHVPDLQATLLIEHMCHDWLQMQNKTALGAQLLAPDVTIWSEDALPRTLDPTETTELGDSPSVVICPNELIAYQYTTGSHSAGRLGTAKFISQPICPVKLAKTISLAIKCWTEAQVGPLVLDVGPVKDVTSGIGSLAVITPPKPPWSHSPMAPMDEGIDPGDCFIRPEFLLVDDNPINLKFLAAYIHKIHHPYDTATNGQEAVDAYKAKMGQFRCILMDISMPVMDGFEATRRIRALERKLHLKPTLILALSGLASEDAQEDALSSGVDLFLTKPVRLKELGAILKLKGILNES
ncbi:hypothetical protein B0J13DRAFT_234723 [Dactylonectria estremocensis]|uniref:histidine kinase n=1 Tax=Dactylonectria estremocensis TaxID=1079267 RepID=A0A9P9F5G2_9HYPO|nr:hypothetical protein B0J13DRAFT_234723 [Dactylonectria estremocensis]